MQVRVFLLLTALVCSMMLSCCSADPPVSSAGDTPASGQGSVSSSASVYASEESDASGTSPAAPKK